MKTLFLIRGVSGAGKSTLAMQLAKKEIAADYFFERKQWSDNKGWIGNGDYDFDPKLLSFAHGWCKSMVKAWMQESDDIAVHNTFTTVKEIEPYLELAKENGFRVISMVVENRHGNSSVHSVPEEALSRQENRLKNSLKLR